MRLGKKKENNKVKGERRVIGWEVHRNSNSKLGEREREDPEKGKRKRENKAMEWNGMEGRERGIW